MNRWTIFWILAGWMSYGPAQGQDHRLTDGLGGFPPIRDASSETLVHFADTGVQISASDSFEEGRLAFQASCTKCHEAGRALQETKTYSGWLETIAEMAAKEDAEIKSSDFQSIANYLVEHAGEASAPGRRETRGAGMGGRAQDSEDEVDQAQVAAGRNAFRQSCVKCHDAERSLSKAKSYSAWLATVRRMAAKDGAEIRASDFEAIAAYLASQSSADGGTSAEGSQDAGGWSFGTTVSTIHRSASDEAFVENPGFFADVWVTASYQSSGAWSATATACTSCHSTNSGSNSWSLELLEGSATVDLRKLFTDCNTDCGPQIALKAGRFPVPFGAFSSMSHPGIYRTVTAPLMFNMGRRIFAGAAAPPRQPVLPLPFADEGIDFMLRAPLTNDVNFGLDVYGVNGLQGDEANMFERSRSYSDNNEEPSLGIRTTLGGEYLRFGASLLHGGLQDQRLPPIDYTLWGADVTSQLTDRWRIYAEFARRRQDSAIVPGASERTFGVVAETEYRLLDRPQISMLIRYDTLENRSQAFGDEGIERLTSGFNISLSGGSLLMINHEHWQPERADDIDLVGVRWSVSL